MHNRINPDIDIIAYVLQEVLKQKPEDAFCQSLQQQYEERGGLSKKQLEGLQGKAIKIQGMHPGHMATLEAIIKKKHVTHRSQVTIVPTQPEKDNEAGKMITDILTKYPQHKRVVLFKTYFEKDGKLPIPEKTELERFFKILISGNP